MYYNITNFSSLFLSPRTNKKLNWATGMLAKARYFVPYISCQNQSLKVSKSIFLLIQFWDSHIWTSKLITVLLKKFHRNRPCESWRFFYDKNTRTSKWRRVHYTMRERGRRDINRKFFKVKIWKKKKGWVFSSGNFFRVGRVRRITEFIFGLINQFLGTPLHNKHFVSGELSTYFSSNNGLTLKTKNFGHLYFEL